MYLEYVLFENVLGWLAAGSVSRQSRYQRGMPVADQELERLLAISARPSSSGSGCLGQPSSVALCSTIFSCAHPGNHLGEPSCGFLVPVNLHCPFVIHILLALDFPSLLIISMMKD